MRGSSGWIGSLGLPTIVLTAEPSPPLLWELYTLPLKGMAPDPLGNLEAERGAVEAIFLEKNCEYDF